MKHQEVTLEVLIRRVSFLEDILGVPAQYPCAKGGIVECQVSEGKEGCINREGSLYCPQTDHIISRLMKLSTATAEETSWQTKMFEEMLKAGQISSDVFNLATEKMKLESSQGDLDLRRERLAYFKKGSFPDSIVLSQAQLVNRTEEEVALRQENVKVLREKLGEDSESSKTASPNGGMPKTH